MRSSQGLSSLVSLQSPAMSWCFHLPCPFQIFLLLSILQPCLAHPTSPTQPSTMIVSWALVSKTGPSCFAPQAARWIHAPINSLYKYLLSPTKCQELCQAPQRTQHLRCLHFSALVWLCPIWAACWLSMSSKPFGLVEDPALPFWPHSPGDPSSLTARSCFPLHSPGLQEQEPAAALLPSPGPCAWNASQSNG